MEVDRDEVILLAHGGGGTLTHKLIKEVLLPELGNPVLEKLDDSACVSVDRNELAFTTDSFVIDPIFFPGGDIGSLSICGTVNDLAMQGARPLFISMGLIIEEGFFIRDIVRIVRSARQICDMTGVSVVTGDTKVIPRNGMEQPRIFINTAGIGVRLEGVDVSVSNARPGDVVVITGPIGEHGTAVMCARGNLKLQSTITSDMAPLWGMVESLLNKVPSVRCLRDPTRGGLAAALCDIASASSCCIRIDEAKVPVRSEVRGACELLGLDPLNVPNEGRAVVVCAPDDVDDVISVLKSHPSGRESAVIGEIYAEPVSLVLLRTLTGGERLVEMPSGENLPRIC